MQIEVEVKGQRIKRINSPGSVEDTLNYLTCYFTFDGEEWDNTVKTAYFRNPASGKTYSQILAEDNTCTVPWEALTDWGFVKFSVSGERENYRITTDIESFYNGETVYGGEPSEPPTPDQYDQMIALAEQTKEIAESVRRDADEGKFDGDPGEPGKPGAPGRDGVSPTAKVEQTDDGAVITITDATGTTTAELKNGKEGNPGQNATDEQVRGAVDAYMAEHPVQGDTEDIIKLAIKNEASGAVPIAVTDSAEMGVQDLEMQGWTEQNQYEGKNLFDISDFETNNKGIIENGTILFKQSLGNVTYYLSLSPGTYSISIKRSGYSGISIKVNEVNVINNGGSNNFTNNFDVSDGDSVALEFSEGQNPNGEDRIIYDIMLNSGSTALPYEPYTGGQPSPNPDYPQEIISAGKYDEETQKYQYEVKLTGKNLWDTIKGSDTSNWVGSTSQSGYSDFAIDVSAGKKVTVSFPEKLPTGKGMFVGIVLTEDGDIDKWMYHSKQEGLIFQQQTVTAAGDKIWIRCNNGSVPWFSSDNPYFQVEYGEERTDFQPYKEQTVTLTSDRPLTKWDKLEKRNGQWGWVYGSVEITLLGQNDSYSLHSGKAIMVPESNLGITEERKDYYSNQFVATTKSINELKNGESRIAYNNLYLKVNAVTSPEEAKSWIQSNKPKFLLQADIPAFVPLSASEQEALNALHTYYPTTTVSNDAGCDMALTYIADTKAYIDNKVSAIQAAIVNAI